MQSLSSKLKKYPLTIIEKTKKYLKEKDYVNDEEYTLHFIKSALNKGKGRKYIEFELLKKGVAAEKISEYMEGLYSENKLSSVSQKKLNSILKDKKTPD